MFKKGVDSVESTIWMSIAENLNASCAACENITLS